MTGAVGRGCCLGVAALSGANRLVCLRLEHSDLNRRFAAVKLGQVQVALVEDFADAVHRFIDEDAHVVGSG